MISVFGVFSVLLFICLVGVATFIIMYAITNVKMCWLLGCRRTQRIQWCQRCGRDYKDQYRSSVWKRRRTAY